MIGPRARKSARMPFDGTLTNYHRRSEAMRGGTMENVWAKRKTTPGTMEYDIARGAGRIMAGMPDTRRMNGMPDTRKMNGDPRENGGRIGIWKTKTERAAERELKGLLKKRNELKDPHQDDNLGKIGLYKGDSLGFIGEKMRRGGSVTATRDGVCLKGEDSGENIGGDVGKLYAYTIKDGERKWRKIETGGASAAGGMFAWNEQSRTMGPGGVMVGRSWVGATGTGSKGNGTYYVKVTFTSGGGATAEVVDQLGYEATTDTACCIPIYTIAGGKVTDDLRGAFVVPAWE